MYKNVEFVNVVGYIDSDWANCLDDIKSTSAYIFFLSSGIVSWDFKKQNCIAQSFVEVEYVAVAKITSQAIWLRRILKEIKKK